MAQIQICANGMLKGNGTQIAQGSGIDKENTNRFCKSRFGLTFLSCCIYVMVCTHYIPHSKYEWPFFDIGFQWLVKCDDSISHEDDLIDLNSRSTLRTHQTIRIAFVKINLLFLSWKMRGRVMRHITIMQHSSVSIIQFTVISTQKNKKQ